MMAKSNNSLLNIPNLTINITNTQPTYENQLNAFFNQFSKKH
jgi:hypothetical protein